MVSSHQQHATNYLSHIYHLLILRYQYFVPFQFLLFALLCSFEVSEDSLLARAKLKVLAYLSRCCVAVLFSSGGGGDIFVMANFCRPFYQDCGPGSELIRILNLMIGIKFFFEMLDPDPHIMNPYPQSVL
jgi:hypothetical protein